MTIADDLRAAAEEIRKVTPFIPDDDTCNCAYCERLRADPNRPLMERLRAHADTVERVEREMRKTGSDGCGLPYELIGWANSLGDSK